MASDRRDGGATIQETPVRRAAWALCAPRRAWRTFQNSMDGDLKNDF